MLIGARTAAWIGESYGWFGITNGAYFDSLENIDDQLAYEYDVIPYVNTAYGTNQQIFGIWDNSTGTTIRYYNAFTYSDSKFSMFRGNSLNEINATINYGSRTSIALDPISGTLTLGDTVYSLPSTISFDLGYNFYIGCQLSNGSASGNFITRMDIKKLVFKRNNVITHNWVGKKVGGVWMPYDTVTDTIATNLGTGSFIGGELEA